MRILKEKSLYKNEKLRIVHTKLNANIYVVRFIEAHIVSWLEHFEIIEGAKMFKSVRKGRLYGRRMS